jgi:hypothetical protein
MDLKPYVDTLRRELVVAADTGGEEAHAVAERLVATLDSATRLVLLDVLSAAAREITSDLAPGSVEIRLRGLDPDFVVTPAVGEANDDDFEPTPTAPATLPAPPPRPEADEGATSRITLRLPEHLKPRIDEAASRETLSVNAWLVRAVSAALRTEAPATTPVRRSISGGQKYTGWVR